MKKISGRSGRILLGVDKSVKSDAVFLCAHLVSTIQSANASAITERQDFGATRPWVSRSLSPLSRLGFMGILVVLAASDTYGVISPAVNSDIPRIINLGSVYPRKDRKGK